MTRLDRFSSIILTAVLAATAGWAASSFSNRHQQISPTPAESNNATLPAGSLQAPDQVSIAPMTSPAMASQFVTPHASTGYSPVAGISPAEALTTPAATRPRVINPQAGNDDMTVARAEAEPVTRANTNYEPRPAKKKGMSKATKNAIVIGGGAAVGAAIGGIASGKKGAAIGAIVGGGSSALYSWIKHKQNKPVF